MFLQDNYIMFSVPCLFAIADLACFILLAKTYSVHLFHIILHKRYLKNKRWIALSSTYFLNANNTDNDGNMKPA